MSDITKYRQEGPLRKQFTMHEMDELGVSLRYCRKPDYSLLDSTEKDFQLTLRKRTISPLYVDITGKYKLSDKYLNKGSVPIIREIDMPDEIYSDLSQQLKDR